MPAVGELILKKLHQSLRLLIRKRFEQNGVHKTKNRRVRPDPDCERQRRHDREPWILPKRAPPLPQIVRKRHITEMTPQKPFEQRKVSTKVGPAVPGAPRSSPGQTDPQKCGAYV